MNFYDTFSKLCNQKQITPSAAAIKIGLTKTAVSNWKTRNTKPTRANLVRIAEFFDVSVDSLLGKEDIKKEPIKNDRFAHDYYLLDEEDKETVDLLVSSLLAKQKYKKESNVG